MNIISCVSFSRPTLTEAERPLSSVPMKIFQFLRKVFSLLSDLLLSEIILTLLQSNILTQQFFHQFQTFQHHFHITRFSM
jgi:hypothetical protein